MCLKIMFLKYLNNFRTFMGHRLQLPPKHRSELSSEHK